MGTLRYGRSAKQDGYADQEESNQRPPKGAQKLSPDKAQTLSECQLRHWPSRSIG